MDHTLVFRLISSYSAEERFLFLLSISTRLPACFLLLDWFPKTLTDHQCNKTISEVDYYKIGLSSKQGDFKDNVGHFYIWNLSIYIYIYIYKIYIYIKFTVTPGGRCKEKKANFFLFILKFTSNKFLLFFSTFILFTIQQYTFF